METTEIQSAEEKKTIVLCDHCAGIGKRMFDGKMTTCEKCGGFGTVVRYPCDACSGTGFIKRSPDVRDNIKCAICGGTGTISNSRRLMLRKRRKWLDTIKALKEKIKASPELNTSEKALIEYSLKKTRSEFFDVEKTPLAIKALRNYLRTLKND